jgi:hypothetical protein
LFFVRVVGRMLEKEVCGNVVWHSAGALCVILEIVIAVSLCAIFSRLLTMCRV